ncbi:hypothetical protein EhV164_00252 [Emiliania huxleyi virus 164]|uniref:Uncharacterized protein n=1 Tax=viral metagenome TaxID=1070528 RepID=A0A6C0LT05_9ZZZZ|nr:hypothetical protein EhV164_00252 [Emiliania huxleyi virus 164]
MFDGGVACFSVIVVIGSGVIGLFWSSHELD